MRKLLGGVVLVLGTGLLGYWAMNSHARRIEHAVEQGAAQVVADTVHGIKTRVSGRDILVSGFADDRAEHDRVLSGLQAVAGRRVIDDHLQILAQASPYEFSISRSGMDAHYAGNIPTELARDALAAVIGHSGAGELKLASGMPDSSWLDVALQGKRAFDLLENGDMLLSDRFLTVAGQAQTPVERDAAIALLSNLPDGYSFIASISVLVPLATPYIFEATKTNQGLRHSGNVPDQTTREKFATFMGPDADELTLAIGMPDSEWPDVVGTALQALDQLEVGEMRMEDRAIYLTGTARTPIEQEAARAMLTALPEGYTARTEITALDDGNPVAYSITYSGDNGAMITGKLPYGADKASIAQALGVADIAGMPTSAGIGGRGDADRLHATLGALEMVVGDIETLELSQNPDGQSLSLMLRPGADAEGVRKTLGETLAQGVVLSVAALPEPEAAPVLQTASEKPLLGPQAGDMRYNGALGLEQVFRNGTWALSPAFQPDKDSCTNLTNNVLAKQRVVFLTGSAELDPQSTRTIENLAAALQGCLGSEDLRVEIGGHTDSDGAEEANYLLGKQRAQAVVAALAALGVPKGRIVAVGYGESEPIADNATAQGKAQNRRTSFKWFTLD